MDYYFNQGKSLAINDKEGNQYVRYAVKTHFVKPGEDYLTLVSKYVKDLYQEGDIVAICEKVVSLCQNRIVKREDMHVGFLAKFLSRFASKSAAGIGVGESIKMQYAIDKVGVLKVIYASLCSAVGKLFGRRGVFYEIVGYEVSGLDGFYDGVWDEYSNIGIEIPEDANGVCNEIHDKFDFSCMIMDANDFGQVILGKSADIPLSDDQLTELIRDNPAGQVKEQTPIILIRKTFDARCSALLLQKRTNLKAGTLSRYKFPA